MAALCQNIEEQVASRRTDDAGIHKSIDVGKEAAGATASRDCDTKEVDPRRDDDTGIHKSIDGGKEAMGTTGSSDCDTEEVDPRSDDDAGIHTSIDGGKEAAGTTGSSDCDTKEVDPSASMTVKKKGSREGATSGEDRDSSKRGRELCHDAGFMADQRGDADNGEHGAKKIARSDQSDDKKSRALQKADRRRLVDLANKESLSLSCRAVKELLGGGSVTVECMGPIKGGRTAGVQDTNLELRERLAAWMMKLTEENMKVMYENCWGWDEKSKGREIRSPNARFLVAYDAGTSHRSDSNDSRDTTPREQPVAFLHYRYVIDESKPVLYVYEIQVESRGRGGGLGKLLMDMAYSEARKYGMRAVVLTCFTENMDACKFYQKIGYNVDESCPTRLVDEESAGYTILSKVVN